MRSSSAKAQPPAVDLPLQSARLLTSCSRFIWLHSVEAAMQSGLQGTTLIVSVNAAGGQQGDEWHHAS